MNSESPIATTGSKTIVGSHPPPWNLSGRGYLVVMRFPHDYLRDQCFLPEELKTTFGGSIAMMMFIDYAAADCGPYRELLFIPGRGGFSPGPLLTISKIYVETENSVVNGRRNWGIPKERCDFETSYNEDRTDRMKLSAGAKPIAELAFRPFGPRLPLIVNSLPKRWLTLGQLREGQEFIYTPRVTGHARLARLIKTWSDPGLFPDLEGAKGSHLTIQQFSHCFHSGLLGAVALQPLFKSFSVRPHYAVVRQPYLCRQFLQLQATQTASQIQH